VLDHKTYVHHANHLVGDLVEHAITVEPHSAITRPTEGVALGRTWISSERGKRFGYPLGAIRIRGTQPR